MIKARLEELSAGLKAGTATTRKYAAVLDEALTAPQPGILFELDVVALWLEGSSRQADAEQVRELAASIRVSGQGAPEPQRCEGVSRG
ncbi:hypothetical protein PY365_15910 [Roseiarcaceae bacterium H3SJ34-1]|uniref:hypothetical protein n=1 Tax=Terripilifer ovatus TaxID=3032367 RepID=UPI003AB993E7|nr:hypothetical protein [Roseiarcaceae bacterium H3SJ34-1]